MAFGIAVYLDPIYAKFIGQGHRSKFKFTRDKRYFSGLKLKVKMGKPDTPQCRLAGRRGRKANMNRKL